MDPSEFLKLTITNLTLTLNPSNPKPTSPPYCLIKLPGFLPQTAFIPLTTPPIFHLTKSHFTTKRRGFIFNINPRRSLTLVLYVFTGKLLGKVSIELDKINGVFFDGWFHVGSGNGSKLRVCIRVEPDPRFVFEFDGEPECSPVVLQSSGSVRQPVFSCKFSLRSSNCVVGDRNNQRTRSLQSEQGSGRGWLSSFGSERERPGKERKGWSITVHDLSGSPVAAASMVTPFVASPGSDRVSKSNPGSWLILRPGEGTWNPWGRLEAWRERGTSDGVGYKFELIPDKSANSGVVLTETTLSTSKGGKFIIDLASPTLKTKFNNNGSSSSISCGGSSKSGQRSSSATGCSPRGGGSGDFGHGLWPFSAHRGFVMSANVGEGKCSKPTVEVSVQHVSCTEDAAAFVALAAAVDLSIDACKLFSQKLRKELCQNNDLGC